MPEMSTRHRISLSIQTFEKLIDTGCIYVDKTVEIHRLITSENGACFFSRPRRFGKSLTVSTLDAIFSGKRHLFKDLAIDQTEYEWPIHPVIRLDMKVAAQPTLERAETGLTAFMDDIARMNGVVLTGGNPEDRFRSLILGLYEKTRQKVVVLIDEYDKPLIDNLDNMDEARKIQGLLKRFYGVLKLADEHLRFIFITGVSKFAKVSVFSDLNQLTDLTFNPQYATLVGLTETELETYYRDYINAIAQDKSWTHDQVMAEIRRWYNGYRFSEKDVRVYNPWSTLSLFYTLKFQEHWYTTGIPKMLVDIINRDSDGFSKLNPADLDQTEPYELSQFEAYDIETLQLVPLLIQTGFITLKAYDSDIDAYRLGYPNFEVRQAFSKMILDTRLTPINQTNHVMARRIKLAVEQSDFEAVIGLLNHLIASIPGNLHTPKESYYHSLIHMIFQVSGLEIRSEEWVAGGRIDTVIEEPTAFYIFEFKFNGSSNDAIDQIKTKRYAEKYQVTGKPVHAIGIGVECVSKSISDWRIEVI